MINISHWSDSNCDLASSFIHEDALENAYDDGIFVAAMAGNVSGPSATSCNLNSPADTPKAFAVNGLDSDGGTCFGDYQTCAIHGTSSALGGGDLVVDGFTHSGALSGIDIAAPTDVYYETQESGNEGTVDEGNRAGGTSTATPHVAASALLLKDWQLSEGHSWIGSPGRLHTMMLGMADRHDGSGAQAIRGIDNQFGMGRVKMRLLDSYQNMSPFAYRMRTYTTLSFSSVSFFTNWSNPLPAGAEILKCVVHEEEDMSSKSDVSDVYISSLTLREPVGGSCDSSGAAVSSMSDASYDLKHMVAFDDDDVNIEGLCPELSIRINDVAGSTTTFHAFCYHAGVEDDEPN